MTKNSGLTKDLLKALAKQPSPAKSRPVDPEEVFGQLKIRPTSRIKEMWRPQADALRAWHKRRDNPDVMLELKTGAGKTLIGLVAAQSLVNETRGRVLYCCATNQLVEQTREKADELGISTATYMSSTWTDQEVYATGRGPLLTNYHALFNGKSIFDREDLAAVVFDDAHTAHDSIRGAFTLTVSRHKYGELYQALVEQVAPYFESVGRDYAYGMLIGERDPSSVLMVPLFESSRHADAFRDALLAHGAETERDFKFAWAHLGEQLDRCIMHFDAETVQFTPLLPVVHHLRAFRKNVRHLYLSATLRINDEFIRTFGRQPDPIITPGGRAGDTQRLFLFPTFSEIDEAQRAWADNATEGKKAVVMVSTLALAKIWRDDHGVEVFDSTQGHARIRQFAASTDERLAFVARYDGVDLPDDDCRVMIVDGLPSGMSLLDRFFEQHLERAGISDAKIASRFVQLLGRTSRGMSDYGTILIVGRRLLDWVLPPKHRALLPDHMQRQIDVGERLSRLEDFTAAELLTECLDQTATWEEVYERGMAEAVIEPPRSAADAKVAIDLAIAERRAAEALWDDEPEEAVRVLSAIRKDAFEAERPLGAWLLHWLAFATQLAGDGDNATIMYRDAARSKRDLGSVPDVVGIANATDPAAHSTQAQAMASLLALRGLPRVKKDLTKAATDLYDSVQSAAVHEEAIRVLGEYLGYTASRPEKTTDGKGPDDLWVRPGDSEVLIFDAKTKKVNTHYNKELIGRSVQHNLWLAAKYPDARRRHFLVGPRVPATPQATPPVGLRIIAPEVLARVADDTRHIYETAHSRQLPLFRAADLQQGLDVVGLGWDDLPDSVETIRLDAL